MLIWYSNMYNNLCFQTSQFIFLKYQRAINMYLCTKHRLYRNVANLSLYFRHFLYQILYHLVEHILDLKLHNNSKTFFANTTNLWTLNNNIWLNEIIVATKIFSVLRKNHAYKYISVTSSEMWKLKIAKKSWWLLLKDNFYELLMDLCIHQI